MYEQHFGLTERPFSIAPDPRFIYMSPQHREALAHLLYGVGEGGGFVQLTGEVGTGKTTICRCLVEQLPENVDVALILNPRISGLELVASLCDELHIPYPPGTGSIKVLTDALNAFLLRNHAEGRRTVLVIDEAQSLTPEALEQVRLLTNLETTREKLLQIVLVGQPELRDLLARDELRQLAQRITARYHLLPISREQTAAYIHHRLKVCDLSRPVFDERAIDRIHKLSQGIPRLINILCDRAMLGAFVEDKQVIDTAVVGKAAREVLPATPAEKPARLNWLWPAAAALLLASLGVGIYQNADRLNVLGRQVATTPVDARVPAPQRPVAEAAATAHEQASPVADAREPLVSAAALNSAVAAVSDERTATTSPDVRSGTRDDPVPVSRQMPPAASSPDMPTGPASAEADLANAELNDPEMNQAELSHAEPSKPGPASAAMTDPDLSGVVQAALQAAAPAGPDLTALLTDAGPAASASAWAGLYRQWGYESAAGNDQQACAQAQAAGLRCMSAAGSWGMLKRFNRPAILMLVSGSGRLVAGLMRRVENDRIALEVDGRPIEVSRDELEKHWYGIYRLLWKKPPSGTISLHPGMRSDDVRWLRERLARVTGESAPAPDPRRYDAGLKALVEAFQRSHGLTADGVAGARTFILLNNVDEQADVPRLSGPASGGPGSIGPGLISPGLIGPAGAGRG